MDYQGNYFPEEHDENESKVYRVIKNIFKWTMYSLSFILYAVLFYLLIVNRDSKILDKNYIVKHGNYENIENEFYRINTIEFMNYDGSIQVYNVDYSDQYGIIEMGIKFNANKLANSDNPDENNKIEIAKSDRKDFLTYVLTDSEGNEYPLIYKEDDYGGRYGFARVAFSSVDIDLDSNDLRFDESDTTKERSEVEYSLCVYRSSDNKLLDKLVIYNNKVTFQREEYDD